MVKNKVNIPEAIKLMARGTPLCVPFDDKKFSFLAYFQAKNNPEANKAM